MIIPSIKSEYLRYKKLGGGAIEQIPDEDINKVFGDDNNSIAVIVSINITRSRRFLSHLLLG